MPDFFSLLLSAMLLSNPTTPPTTPPGGWERLLDQNLSQWRTYQSHRHVPGDQGRPPTNAQGQPLPPIGYDKNEANGFSVVMEHGEPVLRISGEIYGCLVTRQDYANYDLKLRVRWGQQKWPPRLQEPRDSGVLYNSQGEPGVDYWHSWMLSQEFQVSEAQKGNSMGDYWCIANSAADIRATHAATDDTLRYAPAAAPVAMGNGGPHFCYALPTPPAARQRVDRVGAYQRERPERAPRERPRSNGRQPLQLRSAGPAPAPHPRQDSAPKRSRRGLLQRHCAAAFGENANAVRPVF